MLKDLALKWGPKNKTRVAKIGSITKGIIGDWKNEKHKKKALKETNTKAQPRDKLLGVGFGPNEWAKC